MTGNHYCLDADGESIESEYVTCASGVLWGPCEHPDCGGSCSIQGDCHCTCHVRGEPVDAGPR